jgi:outer membrane protein OmpA-like peptidoglycan-associated protein
MTNRITLLAAATALAALATPVLAEKSDRIVVDAVRQRIADARAEPGVAEFGGPELVRAEAALPDLLRMLDNNEKAEVRSITTEIDALIATARLRGKMSGGARSASAETPATLVLQDVMFESGRAELKPGAVARLQPLITYLRANGTVRVRIDGHTDAQGNGDANHALSEHRALAVRDQLAAAGIAPSRIVTVPHGAAQPVASNATAAGRLQNRRVEITLIGHTDHRVALRD